MLQSKTKQDRVAESGLKHELSELLGETASLTEAAGRYTIKIYHTRAFPWDEVFKLLLYRNFKVQVKHQEADIYIEATH